MPTVPKTTTVATATATSSARPLTTGSVASTAAAPQIELPAPTSKLVRASMRNTRWPSHCASTKVLDSTTASMAMPAQPSWAMSWKVRRRPYSTMPARSSLALDRPTPLAQGAARRG